MAGGLTYDQILSELSRVTDDIGRADPESDMDRLISRQEDLIRRMNEYPTPEDRPFIFCGT